MARILQVSCDSNLCYNNIEVVDYEEYDAVRVALDDFGWSISSHGEDFCPDCSLDEEYEDDKEEDSFL